MRTRTGNLAPLLRRETIVAFAVLVVLVVPGAFAQGGRDLVDLSGLWVSSHGWEYHIEQEGPAFAWTVGPPINQRGEGQIEGDFVAAHWGGHGEGSAAGRVFADESNRAYRIEWDNGLVFEREPGRLAPAGIRGMEPHVSEPDRMVVPEVPGWELAGPRPELVERLDLEWVDNVMLGFPSDRQLDLRRPEDVCWKERFKQCQQWRDAGSPPPMPPLDPACAPFVIIDPCYCEAPELINCAKIPCPKSFKKGVTCWSCF